MPVLSHSYAHFQAPAGNAPAAPTAVTSVTADASATVSFRAGAQGDAPVSSWTVTPYIAGSAQSPQTVGTGSATSLTGSDGNAYTQVPVTGLTNSTAYTFSVHGTSSVGAGAESSQSGANTPLAGLVFGDDFNGPAGGAIDPEWWLLDVASTSDEDDYYRPDHVSIDGSGNLVLLATGDAYGGKPFTTGCVQNNVRNFFPAAGNTLTLETRAQVCSQAGGEMWPSPWCSGTGYQQSFKTDQNETSGWDSGSHAEIDVAEWIMTGNTSFQVNTWVTSSPNSHTYSAGVNLSLAQHVYRCDYKPSAGTTFFFDGGQIYAQTAAKPTGALFFMWFQQIQAGNNPSFPQRTYVDYVRIYDRNLG